ncbi:HEAT repeat domain-containing protein [Corallococcus sp. Z5C101001]|uniref:HEAT repeat domain-containing protein n=1 Tax=Corallococcus sp. Z5C101001 TaxID=2596829 RepID=UPI00163DB7B6|nr:HEAT repeat domain-containing protein [Corallococcus sp. Z5C101001]
MRSLLDETPRESADSRCRIVWLLGIVGGAGLHPLLKSLLLDPREDPLVRDMALRAVLKHGMTLSARELLQLHEEAVEPDAPSFKLSYLLFFVRLEDFGADIEEALARMDPGDRARLLSRLRGCDRRRSLAGLSQRQRVVEALLESNQFRFPVPQHGVPQPPALMEWLFARWNSCDRQLLEAQGPSGRLLNVNVALALRERPEAWTHLVEWSRELTAEQLEDVEVWMVWRQSPDALAGLTGTSPSLRRWAVETLLLPLSDLLAHLGEDGLLRRLERVVRMESVACTVPCGLVKHPRAFRYAREVLCEWGEARRRVLYRLLCDFDVASSVRMELLDALWVRDRAVAVRWALAAERYPDNSLLVERILRYASANPLPADRPLFLAVLRGPHEERWEFALKGLLALGESGAGWCDKLLTLTHDSSPRVRLQAFAGLVQQGRREWLDPLRRLAHEEPDPWTRAEALGWLGTLDAEESRPLFLAVLADARARGAGEFPSLVFFPHVSPEVEEAIRALSRRGTEEDLSALLNASLSGCCSMGLDQQLEGHLTRYEGPPAKDVPEAV